MISLPAGIQADTPLHDSQPPSLSPIPNSMCKDAEWIFGPNRIFGPNWIHELNSRWVSALASGGLELNDQFLFVDSRNLRGKTSSFRLLKSPPVGIFVGRTRLSFGPGAVGGSLGAIVFEFALSQVSFSIFDVAILSLNHISHCLSVSFDFAFQPRSTLPLSLCLDVCPLAGCVCWRERGVAVTGV
jgi:hypothetical protein